VTGTGKFKNGSSPTSTNFGSVFRLSKNFTNKAAAYPYVHFTAKVSLSACVSRVMRFVPQVNGEVPDMESSTKYYNEIKRVYASKAANDRKLFSDILHSLNVKVSLNTGCCDMRYYVKAGRLSTFWRLRSGFATGWHRNGGR